MTKIVKIVCPGCQQPMFSKEIDSVLLCESCGTIHARDGGTEVVPYDVGQFTRQGQGERVYLPHWAMDVQYAIGDIQSSGGGGFLSGLLGQNPAKAGTLRMNVPAYDLDPEEFKALAMRLTGSPPSYAQSRLEPGVKRARCAVDADQLEQVADFMFVTGIAEKPGVLQSLDYTLKVTGKKLIYLPYYKKGDSLQPGF